MESNHAPPAFRADVLTTVLERSVDHSFRSVLCSKGNTSNITRRKRRFGIGGRQFVLNMVRVYGRSIIFDFYN